MGLEAGGLESHCRPCHLFVSLGFLRRKGDASTVPLEVRPGRIYSFCSRDVAHDSQAKIQRGRIGRTTITTTNQRTSINDTGEACIDVAGAGCEHESFIKPVAREKLTLGAGSIQ